MAPNDMGGNPINSKNNVNGGDILQRDMGNGFYRVDNVDNSNENEFITTTPLGNAHAGETTFSWEETRKGFTVVRPNTIKGRISHGLGLECENCGDVIATKKEFTKMWAKLSITNSAEELISQFLGVPTPSTYGLEEFMFILEERNERSADWFDNIREGTPDDAKPNLPHCKGCNSPIFKDSRFEYGL